MSPARLYVSIRELHRGNGPVIVEREGPHAHVVFDPRTPRIDVVTGMVDQLTREETRRMAGSFGHGLPFPDWVTAEGPALLYVPKEMRLPGADALQGGATLERRWRLGQLDLEMEALSLERERRTIDLTGAFHRLAA